MSDDLYRQIMDGPIPEGPLFPEAMGPVLHAFLNADPPPGPPYVHTFAPPEPEYGQDGVPYWPLDPHYTITDLTDG